MSEQSVQEQLRQQLSTQVEPQGWYVYDIQEQDLAGHHMWLSFQSLSYQKNTKVIAVYAAAFASEQYPGFLHCCKVYVFEDGSAQPLEWWGQTSRTP